MKNVGTILYVLIFYTLLIIAERIWSKARQRCPLNQCSTKYHSMLHRFLYWGAINTLAMEIYLDIGLSATLNVHLLKWLENNPDLVVTNLFAIFCLLFLIAYPIWVIIFYLKNFRKW